MSIFHRVVGEVVHRNVDNVLIFHRFQHAMNRLHLMHSLLVSVFGCLFILHRSVPPNSDVGRIISSMTCQGCGHVFTRSTSMHKHVERGACPAMRRNQFRGTQQNVQQQTQSNNNIYTITQSIDAAPSAQVHPRYGVFIFSFNLDILFYRFA
jgi:hypothetical protein